MPRFFLAALTALALVYAVGCKNDDAPFVDEPGRCASVDPLKQVYWGDTHVHTVLSFDANMQGTRTTQEDAYAFARGKPISLQPYQEDGARTRMARLERPLDFVMLSDHAELLGTIAACHDPGSPAYDAEQCINYRASLEFDADPDLVSTTFVEINGTLAAPQSSASYPALCGADGGDCLDAGMDVWNDIVRAAEAAYDRNDSCELTTFPGYEWSGNPSGRNLHRNVMFKNGVVTDLPYGYFDEPYPEGLWDRLQQECLDADDGCDVLTIPHNSNLSEGDYFENEMANGEPLDAEYVQIRNAMEPVIEIYQHKGASECLPGAATEDELCGFEIIPFQNLATTNAERITPPDPRGFLRFAYGEGMKHEANLGTNPFQYGITAATDTHISAPGFVAEDEFEGHGGAGQPNRFLPPPAGFPDGEYLSPGGLTAVWAEENARDAIFSAIRRKETFGTSGPRIVVRMFGGWDFTRATCDQADFAEQGYERGVPMGGTLQARPAGSNAPTFLVSAKQDSESAPLQRIQIVKGWLNGDEYQVKVFNVTENPDNGASVDLATCELQGEGASSLCDAWQDPEFDPSQRAYYYARVIENPTCRWSTLQCAEADYDCNDWDYDACVELNDDRQSNYTCDCCDPAAGLNQAACEGVDCSDPGLLPEPQERCCYQVETTIQERAWTSPIWYQPPG
jgi:hypothetical protein